MVPQVSRSQFPWSSPVVIVKSEDVTLSKEEIADLVLGSLSRDTPRNTLNAKPQPACCDLKRENTNVKKALEQCLKREGAIQAVFVQTYEKKEEMAKKAGELRAKELELQEQEAQLKLDRKRYHEDIPLRANAKLKQRMEDVESKLAHCLERENKVKDLLAKLQEKEQQLAHKQVKLNKKEAHLETVEGRLRVKKEELNEQRVIFDRHLQEKKELANLYMASIEHETKKVVSPLHTRTTRSVAMHILIGSRDLFEREDFSHLDEYEGFLSSEDMQTVEIQLLRHGYYKGWFDCMKAEDERAAFDEGKLVWDEVLYLWNVKDPRSPLNAGWHVGALFGWSASCHTHGKRDKDVRLDGRTWEHVVDLEPIMRTENEVFWKAVKQGVAAVTDQFMNKNNNWDEIFTCKADPEMAGWGCY